MSYLVVPFGPNSDNHRWAKTPTLSAISEFYDNDSRTAARDMIRAKIPEKQVMFIVGWKTRAMFDRYNIIDERDVHVAGAATDLYIAELNEKVRTKVSTVENEEALRTCDNRLTIQ